MAVMGSIPTMSMHVLQPIRHFAWTPPESDRKYPMDDALLPQIAIIGRPNVGKSALFNKLLRKQVALVYDTPETHVTRDYKEGIGKLGDLRFRVIDTSGLEPHRPQQSIQVLKQVAFR